MSFHLILPEYGGDGTKIGGGRVALYIYTLKRKPLLRLAFKHYEIKVKVLLGLEFQ